jgi:hypothetical protein
MPAKAGIQYAGLPRINHQRRGVLDHPPSRMMTGVAGFTPQLSLQILLHIGAQAVAQIGARHAEGDVGAQKA